MATSSLLFLCENVQNTCMEYYWNGMMMVLLMKCSHGRHQPTVTQTITTLSGCIYRMNTMAMAITDCELGLVLRAFVPAKKKKKFLNEENIMNNCI